MFSSPMYFRFIEDDIYENGRTRSTKLDKIKHYIFTGGLNCPKNSTLEMSGPWVVAFDVSEPDVFSLHILRPCIHEIGGGPDLPN